MLDRLSSLVNRARYLPPNEQRAMACVSLHAKALASEAGAGCAGYERGHAS
jgi:hypothetical protein